MSTEENKAIARRLIEEAWSQGNLDVLDELMHPDYAGRHSQVPNLQSSRERYKGYIVTTRTALPDFHATVEDQIAEGDLVVTRWAGRGTHKGTHLGIPPTNKHVTVTGIVIERIVDGKTVEGWVEMDLLGMLQRLGGLPAPGQAGKGPL